MEGDTRNVRQNRRGDEGAREDKATKECSEARANAIGAGLSTAITGVIVALFPYTLVVLVATCLGTALAPYIVYLAKARPRVLQEAISWCLLVPSCFIFLVSISWQQTGHEPKVPDRWLKVEVFRDFYEEYDARIERNLLIEHADEVRCREELDVRFLPDSWFKGFCRFK